MNWEKILMESLNKFLGRVVTFLPNLLAMITILILGFLVAWVVKRVLLRFLNALQFDKRSEHWGFPQILSKGGVAFSPTLLVSRFTYWVIVVVSLLLGVNALEINPIQTFIAHFFDYLPNFFAAILIMVVGYLLALFFSQTALIAAVNAHIDSAKFISRGVRWFITLLAMTMALYHLGIAEKVVVAAFSITFGGIALALAIAFGWGGRELAKDFLEKLTRRKEEKKNEKNHISHV